MIMMRMRLVGLVMVIMIITVMTVLMMRFCTICSRGPAEWFPLALASSLLPKTINYEMLIVMMARMNMLHQQIFS